MGEQGEDLCPVCLSSGRELGGKIADHAGREGNGAFRDIGNALFCFGNGYVIIVIQKKGKSLYGGPIIDIVDNAVRERCMEPCAGGTVTEYIRDIITDAYEYLYINELFRDGLAGGINIRITFKFIRYGKMHGFFCC